MVCSVTVIYDNLLWARALIPVIKGGAKVSLEPAAKVAFSSKQSACH